RERTDRKSPTKPRNLAAGCAVLYAHGRTTRSVFDERLEPLAARRMAELAERFCLDLADALARDLEVLADLFERVVALLADAEPHAQDLLLARGQRREHLPRLICEVHADHALARADDRLVLDEVAEMRVFLFADRRLEADRLLRDLQDLADLVE